MANLRVDKITSTETFETTGSVQFFDPQTTRTSIPDSATFQLGSDDFTMECWRLKRDDPSNAHAYASKYTSPVTNASFWFGSVNVFRETFYWYDGTNEISIISDKGTSRAGQWDHIAASREGNIFRLFINGKLVGSRSSAVTLHDDSNDLTIGSDSSSSKNELDGFLSNLRIIKGKAIYTTNFKPPMRELEVTPETILLCCQSKTNAIFEKTGKTITVGEAIASELTPGLLTPIPKAGAGSAITGSVEFDGNNDYLQVAPNSDLSLTGDFTVEYWVYMSKSEADMRQIGSNNYYVAGKNGNWYFGIHNESTPNVYFYTYDGQSNAEFVGVTYTSSLNSWYHLAAARVGNTLTIYVNGVKLTSGTISKDLIDGSVGGIQIGRLPSYGYHNGFISNLRIVKGTALYIDNFIPPTRELRRVPGTVLLCCQDPNNPLTEAIGKTITGHGGLHQVDTSIDLAAGGTWVDGSTGAGSASESNGQITMQGNGASDRGIISKTVTVEPGITYEMSFNITDAASNGKLGLDSNDGTSDILDDPTATIDMVHFSGASLDGNTGTYKVSGVAKSTECVMYFQEFGAAGTTNFIVDNITLHAVGGGGKGASNFTPQVGDDRKVTFEGVTKINSNAYFYLPTGDTATRESRSGYGNRGISFGGSDGTDRLNLIDHINISTTGNAQSFGDLIDKINQGTAVASSTRGISAGGFGTSPINNELLTMEYITIASTGNSLNFGDLTLDRRLLVGCSSQTRGVFAGGYDSPNKYNTMDYVTIASTGNAIDFGDMIADGQTPSGRYSSAGYGSPTRGVWHGGYGHPAYRNIIDYVTIASTGNTKDFGDTSITNYYMGGCSNSIRGLSGGAFNPSPGHINLIEYTTIATTGNAQDFGDLTSGANSTGACASQIRGLWIGATIQGSYSNRIDYVTIMTMGNAQDFGDLTDGIAYNAGCSNGHGGL